MKPSQVLLVFVGVFVFLTVGLLAISRSPDQLLAQSAPSPTIGQAPTTGTMPATSPPQDEAVAALPWEIDAPYQTYLPAIMTPACQLNSNEATLASLISTYRNETGRPSINCNPTLAEVGRQRALDMGQRNYCNHVNPDGNGPDILVSNAGYRLPTEWAVSPTSNHIEVIACGFPTAQDALNAWKTSPEHNKFILGEENFTAQTNYGVGYAEITSGEYRFYWVFILAPPE